MVRRFLLDSRSGQASSRTAKSDDLLGALQDLPQERLPQKVRPGGGFGQSLQSRGLLQLGLGRFLSRLRPDRPAPGLDLEERQIRRPPTAVEDQDMVGHVVLTALLVPGRVGLRVIQEGQGRRHRLLDHHDVGDRQIRAQSLEMLGEGPGSGPLEFVDLAQGEAAGMREEQAGGQQLVTLEEAGPPLSRPSQEGGGFGGHGAEEVFQDLDRLEFPLDHLFFDGDDLEAMIGVPGPALDPEHGRARVVQEDRPGVVPHLVIPLLLQTTVQDGREERGAVFGSG